MINKKTFFASIRQSLFGGSMSLSQVKGILAILTEWERRGLTDKRWLAYMLATTFHEVAGTMQPIEEYGRGRNKMYGRAGKNGKVFYGRGLVQLTWASNYIVMGKVLGIDLFNKPELALHLDIAVKILFEGMIRGLFTGRKLSDYFNHKTDNVIQARRIINGVRRGEILPDKTILIAGYYEKFLKALQ